LCYITPLRLDLAIKIPPPNRCAKVFDSFDSPYEYDYSYKESFTPGTFFFPEGRQPLSLYTVSRAIVREKIVKK
jgi:hypothetical protein